MNPIQKITESLNSKHVAILIIALSFILYGNTLWNGYALDDAIVITQNSFTKQGISGISDILKHDSFTGFFGTKKNK